MVCFNTDMEIKRYIPEITAVGIAELGPVALAAKQAIEGNPLTVKELANYFGFATFYVGIPAAIVISTARTAYAWYRNRIFGNNRHG